MKKQFLFITAGILMAGVTKAQLIPQMDFVKPPQYDFQSPITEITLNAGVGLFEEKVNGTWRNKSRMTGIKDAQGNQRVFSSEEWDTVGNVWISEASMTQDFTYNASNKPTTNYFVLYQSGAKYMSRSQTITYDGTGKYNPIQSMDSIFLPTIMGLGGVDSIVYDGSGRIEQRVFARSFMGVYQVAMRYKYSYNGSGQLIEFLEQDFSSSGGIWTSNKRSTFTYNAAGKIVTVAKDEYNDPNWDLNEMDSFGYDASGKCISFTSFSGMGSGWDPEDQQLFSYTGDNITEMIERLWTGTTWENEKKAVITYSGSAPQSALIYPWNGTSWDADYNERVNFTGGSIGMLKINKAQLEIYPNPASENLTLVGMNKAATAIVTDLQGKEVLRANVDANQSTIQIGGLDAGIYIISLQSNEQVFSSRFVKE